LTRAERSWCSSITSSSHEVFRPTPTPTARAPTSASQKRRLVLRFPSSYQQREFDEQFIAQSCSCCFLRQPSGGCGICGYSLKVA
jgi:hypothetical protein